MNKLLYFSFTSQTREKTPTVDDCYNHEPKSLYICIKAIYGFNLPYTLSTVHYYFNTQIYIIYRCYFCTQLFAIKLFYLVFVYSLI